MEAVERVQGLPSVLGEEPHEEALECLDLALLADLQSPLTSVQLISGGEVALADWPATSSTPSAVTPSSLIRARRLATAIPAAQCTVSQAVPKMRATSCHNRRLANWLGTDRRPLSRAARRRPAEAFRPWAYRNAGAQTNLLQKVPYRPELTGFRQRVTMTSMQRCRPTGRG